MSDVKVVIALLCKYLHHTVGATIKPEHFRFAKYQTDTDDTVIELWRLLCQLCSYTQKSMPGNIVFSDYDDVTSVKLYFAYLQYPVPEFYALPLDCQGSSRELLLAFAWLIATQNVLTIAIQEKISSSILSEEFSNTQNSPKANICEHEKCLSRKTQLNRMVYECGKINYNLKAISELVREKVKLTTKVHAASINVCGLPHLSVSEMALTKRLAFEKSTTDQRRMHELHELASILDTHMKWESRRHIFFDWMLTVIEEDKGSQNKALSDRESDYELSRFVCLLRHIVRKNLHNLKHDTGTLNYFPPRSSCVSRFLRTQLNSSGIETWLCEAKEESEIEEVTANGKIVKLTSQLKKMLKLIPHCVQV